jgi:hypothetical protein
MTSNRQSGWGAAIAPLGAEYARIEKFGSVRTFEASFNEAAAPFIG